jgi:hypothetical protein
MAQWLHVLLINTCTENSRPNFLLARKLLTIDLEPILLDYMKIKYLDLFVTIYSWCSNFTNLHKTE